MANETLKSGIEELFKKHADENYGGHYTIMKFTTEYRVCFGTPNNREDIAFMFNSKTIEGAMWKCIRVELNGPKIELGKVEREPQSLFSTEEFFKNFLENECVIDYNCSVDKQELFEGYQQYAKYCSEATERPIDTMGKTTFYEQLNKTLRLREYRPSSGSPRRYKGITLIRSNARRV